MCSFQKLTAALHVGALLIYVLAQCFFVILIVSTQMFSGWDRNFALEMYGEKSMCFDHTDQVDTLILQKQNKKLLFYMDRHRRNHMT